MLTGHLPELLIVLVLALIVFGPQKLPEVGSAVGKGLREFRRATGEIEDAVLHHDDVEAYEEQDSFPHVPPAPDMPVETTVTPSVDTLAMRREARQRRSVAETSVNDHLGTPS